MASTTSSNALTSRIGTRADGGREGKLLSLVATSSRKNGETKIFKNGSSLSVAQFLAWKHIQERNGAVIQSLPERLANCDLDFQYESRDTQWSQQVAVNELVKSITTNNSTEEDGERRMAPFAIVGTTTSKIADPIAVMGSGYNLPLISGGATSVALEDKSYYGGTIPTNHGDARAMILYLKSIGVEHMAALFQQDDWGRNYNAVLSYEASQHDINLMSFSCKNKDEDSIRHAIIQLKESGMRYVFFMVYSWNTVIRVAVEEGVAGNDQYVWFAAGKKKFNRVDRYQLAKDDEVQQKEAMAVDGIGTVSLHFDDTNPGLEQAMIEFAKSPVLQKEFIDTHPASDRYIFENYTFPDPPAPISAYHHLFYDAIVGVVLAACETPGLFIGAELKETLAGLEFEGASGHVRFNPKTGVRDPKTAKYRIDNVYIDANKSDVNFTRFETQMAAVVFDNQVLVKHNSSNSTESTDWSGGDGWRYHGNATIAPPDLEILLHDNNMIPTAVQSFGWSLAAALMILSVGLMVCVYWCREVYVIRASQPIFLGQLCLGTLFMASAIIPMGMQGLEGSIGLDVACMSTVWLVCCGFVLAFSALVSKTMRLNQLMKAGRQMRRVSVSAKSVAWTTALLLVVNVGLLLGWTIVSPLQYQRIDGDDIDPWGRSLESHGACKSNNSAYLYFCIPLIVINFIGLAVTAFQSYKARQFPTELSESAHLALATASLLETMTLGGPVLVAARDEPTAFYLVGSALITITIFSILLPVFLPKYALRRAIANNKGTGRKRQPRPRLQQSNVSNISGLMSNSSANISNISGLMSNSDAELDAELLAAELAANEMATPNQWGMMKITRHGPGQSGGVGSSLYGGASRGSAVSTTRLSSSRIPSTATSSSSRASYHTKSSRISARASKLFGSGFIRSMRGGSFVASNDGSNKSTSENHK